MNDYTIKELMQEITQHKTLSSFMQHTIVQLALTKAQNSEDYFQIAITVCHDKFMANKEWGRKLYQETLLQMEIEGNKQDLIYLAVQVGDKRQLGDVNWSLELLTQGIQLLDQLDEMIKIAECLAKISDAKAKTLLRTALEKALSKCESRNDLLSVVKLIAYEKILGDKEWAWKVILSIPSDEELAEAAKTLHNIPAKAESKLVSIAELDYADMALVLAHEKYLNSKEAGLEFIKQAIAKESGQSVPDYLDIAYLLFDEQVFQRPQWAAELCMLDYRGINDTQNLISRAMIIYQQNPQVARLVIEHAIAMVEKSDNLDSDDMYSIAANVSAEIGYRDGGVLPFFYDKEWGETIFQKAIKMAESNEQKELIQKGMKEFL